MSFAPISHPFLLLGSGASLLLSSQFSLPFFFFHSPTPVSILLQAIFKKLVGMTLLLTSILTVFLQEEHFSFLCCCALYFIAMECDQIFNFFQPHAMLTSSLVVFRSDEEKTPGLCLHSQSNEECQAYISACQHASSLMAKDKAQYETRSSLLNQSILSSAPLLVWLPNFSNCSSSREMVSVYANYLRSHFSFSQPKALHSRVTVYLYELRRGSCLENFIPLPALCSTLLNFLRLQPTSYLPLLPAQT